MSESVLERLLCRGLSLQDLRNWFCGEVSNVETDCTPQEFAVFFLTNLRECSSRYVQSSSAVSLTGQTNESLAITPGVAKRNKVNALYSRPSLSVSYEENTSIHTSTPKRHLGKSFSGTETSFNVSRENVHHFRHNKSAEHKQITLENFLTDNLVTKKKKNTRRSYSPHAQQNNNKNTSLEERKYSTKHDEGKTNKNRRIKPTILLNRSPIVSNNSFSFGEGEIELSPAWQRSVLREERQKIAARTSDLSTVTTRTSRPAVAACLHLVTNHQRLNALSEIYCAVLQLGLAPGACSELHFLLTLLLAGSEATNDATEEPLFGSLHNCVYFAANALPGCVVFLRMLDRATQRLLRENARVSEFCPQLINELRPASDSVRCPSISVAEHQASFADEGDGRDAFPSEVSYHAFRKQRDGVCELQRLWEAGHSRPGWCYSAALGAKTRAILSSCMHPANLLRLARLFVRWLLSYDVTEGTKPGDLLDLSSERLQKLNSRLERGDTKEEFPRKQEFFREFIESAQNCVMFIRLLEHCLADQLLALEDDFCSRLTDADCCPDYLTFLKRSRLLAKFFGYVHALPYSGEPQPHGAVLCALVAARTHSAIAIPCEERLKCALSERRGVVTLPWVIEFLRRLDVVSLHLPSYTGVIKLLLRINFEISIENDSIANSFARLCLARLFEAPNFPREMFHEAIASLPRKQDDMLPLQLAGDRLKLLMSEHVFYECVPELHGLRGLLASGAAPTSMRYIRPVTAPSTPTAAQDSSKRREQQFLEDVFFRGHPDSVRRSVDFVSERIASAIVKTIRGSWLQLSIESASNKLHSYVVEHRSHQPKQSLECFLRCAVQEARAIAGDELSKLITYCENESRKIAETRSSHCIPALLPDDVHPMAAIACVSLATRKATDRVQHWIGQTLDVEQIMDPLTRELSKIEEQTKAKHNLTTHYLTVQEFSMVKLLTDNKQLMLTLHEKPDTLTSQNLQDALEYTKIVFQRRKDLGSTLKDAVSAQIVDLAVTVAVNRPELAEQNVTLFVDCLETFLPRANSRESRRAKERNVNVLNARNVYLLCEGPNGEASWAAFKAFVMELLNRRVLQPGAFEEQVLKLYQRDIPEVMFPVVTLNIKQMIDGHGASPELVRAAACLTSFLVDDLHETI